MSYQNTTNHRQINNEIKLVRPIIIYSSNLSKECNGPNIRLPPTFIGVKTDPSRSNDTSHKGDDDSDNDKNDNIIVNQDNDNHKESLSTTYTTTSLSHDDNIKSKITGTTKVLEYKVYDNDGTMKRRMTTKEKKEYKYKMILQKKEQSKLRHKQKEEEEKEKKLERKRKKRKDEKNDNKSYKKEKKNGDNNNTTTMVNNNKKEQDVDRIIPTDIKTIKDDKEDHIINNDKKEALNDIAPTVPLQQEQKNENKKTYYKLDVNPKVLQEEIEEQQKNNDKRSLKTPVLLSGSMASCVMQHASSFFNVSLSNTNTNDYINQKQQSILDEIHSYTTNTNNNNVELVSNDILATKWCVLTKDRLKIAEKIRENDLSIRPMVYHIVPEIWSRLRPSSSSTNDCNEIDLKEDSNDVDTTIAETTNENNQSNTSYINTTNKITKIPYSFLTIRKQSSHNMKDVYHQLLLQHLCKKFPSMHISCGIKFGCDYLLYHTNRHDCHSFAGLRLLLPDITTIDKSTLNDDTMSKMLPIPCPYDLSGYVRGLNAANKLALIATILPSAHQKYQILMIDLALEKLVLTEEQLKRHSTWKKHNKHLMKNRKVVGLHLDKSKQRNNESVALDD